VFIIIIKSVKKNKMEMVNMNKNLFVFGVLFVFMAGLVYGAQAPIDLGTAGNFVILAKSGISTTGVTAITGDIGVSPITSTAITGFSLVRVGTYSTSSLVTGKVYASNYDSPTPSYLTTAVSDMQTAYVDGAGRPTPDFTNLGAGDLGGMNLSAGLYKFTTGVTIPTHLILNGSSSDVFIFQIDQTLDLASATNITLTGGVQAKNVFWIVGMTTTLGTTSHFEGNILDMTNIAMLTGATINGRALSQTATDLDANTVSMPSGVTSVVFVPPVARGIEGGSSGSRAINNNGTVDTSDTSVVSTPKASFWDRNKAYIIGLGALAVVLFILSRVFKGKPTRK
jgi:hypothetical protein